MGEYVLKLSSLQGSSFTVRQVNQTVEESIKQTLDVTFVFFISLLLVTQHVSGNHVPIIRSAGLRGVIALCWYCTVAA